MGLSTSMVKKCFTECCCAHTGTRDGQHPQHTIEVATPKPIEIIQDMLLVYRRLKDREIIEKNLKKWPSRKRFGSNDEIKQPLDELFVAQRR